MRLNPVDHWSCHLHLMWKKIHYETSISWLLPVIPCKWWVAKCCHPGIDGVAIGDNRRKRWGLKSILGERYVVDGGGVSGVEEEVGVPFDEGVHLQERRWGSNDRSKSHWSSLLWTKMWPNLTFLFNQTKVGIIATLGEKRHLTQGRGGGIGLQTGWVWMGELLQHGAKRDSCRLAL